MTPTGELSNGSNRRPGTRRSRSLRVPGLPYILAAWAFAALLDPAMLAGQGDRYAILPSGERVRLDHVMRHGGVVTDFWRYLDEDGNAVMHGIYLRSYRNGEKRELITYAHGLKHGPFIKWGDHEAKEFEGTYHQGKLEGRIVWYYPSGKTRNEEHYRRGELNGPFAWYHENGQTRESGAHVDGVRHGPYTEFHENGQLYIEATYHHGMFTGEIVIRDETGEIRSKGMLEKDRVAGGWICFPPEGAPPRTREDCKGRIYVVCTCE